MDTAPREPHLRFRGFGSRVVGCKKLGSLILRGRGGTSVDRVSRDGEGSSMFALVKHQDLNLKQ